jgi:formylmethanofuran dehydrogenase subunit B
LIITVEGDHVAKIGNGCHLAEAWFPAQTQHRPPVAAIDGQPAALEAAVERAAGILAAAKNPLIFGLARSTTDGQRAAIALAERLGATIDAGSAPATRATQQVGQSTCTLGEVKSRADLVLFWGCDPATTKPRFLERFIDAPGRFTPKGRMDRFVVVVDQDDTATAKEASVFLKLELAKQWETLWNLRLLLAGKPVREIDPTWALLLDRMKTCRFGVVFFNEKLDHRTAEALFQLASELNQFTRFYANPMSQTVSGASNTLTWQTGYPSAVNFAAGSPRYNPGEFGAAEMLARKEIDACLLIGSDSIPDFPSEALAHLKSVPVIRFDSPATICDWNCAVSFTTSASGIHTPGFATRMDGVTIPLKVLLPTEYPSDADVLNSLLAAVGGGCAN